MLTVESLGRLLSGPGSIVRGIYVHTCDYGVYWQKKKENTISRRSESEGARGGRRVESTAEAAVMEGKPGSEARPKSKQRKEGQGRASYGGARRKRGRVGREPLSACVISWQGKVCIGHQRLEQNGMGAVSRWPLWNVLGHLRRRSV